MQLTCENAKIRLDEACAIAKALDMNINDLCKELVEETAETQINNI
jgi:hypothetical protein